MWGCSYVATSSCHSLVIIIIDVVDSVLEKDKNELHVKLLQADKERRIATQRETDLARKVCTALYSTVLCTVDSC